MKHVDRQIHHPNNLGRILVSAHTVQWTMSRRGINVSNLGANCSTQCWITCRWAKYCDFSAGCWHHLSVSQRQKNVLMVHVLL